MNLPLSAPALRTKIYLDSSELTVISGRMLRPQGPAGLTCNPTLLAKAGVKDYGVFCRDVTMLVPDKPVSFEVLECRDMHEMKRQALVLSAFGPNVFVKIPVLTLDGHNTWELVKELRRDGVKVNITGITNRHQLAMAFSGLCAGVPLPAIVSIFAGRIADRGVDPSRLVSEAVHMSRGLKGTEVLWASTREVWNIAQAELCGCQIITLPEALLAKAEKEYGQPVDGDDMTLSVINQFDRDAVASGLTI